MLAQMQCRAFLLQRIYGPLLLVNKYKKKRKADGQEQKLTGSMY